jgi:hypothetical protein
MAGRSEPHRTGLASRREDHGERIVIGSRAIVSARSPGQDGSIPASAGIGLRFPHH